MANPMDSVNWTESQHKLYSSFQEKIAKAKKHLEVVEEAERAKGLSYVQQRAEKSLRFHQRSLENLEREFQAKKEEHEEAIKNAKKTLESKAPCIVRAQILLEQAIRERDSQFGEVVTPPPAPPRPAPKPKTPPPPPPPPPPPKETEEEELARMRQRAIEEDKELKRQAELLPPHPYYSAPPPQEDRPRIITSTTKKAVKKMSTQ